MSEHTENLSLPYIMPAQAQKHVTHNEALRALDALVHINIADKDQSAPPAEPDVGMRFIVSASALGDWAGHEGDIAAFQDGAWAFYPPQKGWTVWIEDDQALEVFDGSSWNAVSGGLDALALGDGTLSQLGVNAAADAVNRVSVNSEALLFSHTGAGVQAKINKSSATDTASLLFQTDFSGRAEFGTTGNDDFRIKVSADGASFHEGLQVDRNNGQVSFPSMDGAWVKVVNSLPAAENRKTNTLYLVSNGTGVDAYATDDVGTLYPFSGAGSVPITNYSLSATWTATASYAAGSPAGLGDGDLSGTNYWANTNSLPVTIMCELAAPIAITRYGIARDASNPGWGSNSYSPADWTVEASSDGTNWTLVDTQSGVSSIQVGVGFVDFSFSNTTPYLYYRWTFTAAVSGNWINISEIELHDS